MAHRALTANIIAHGSEWNFNIVFTPTRMHLLCKVYEVLHQLCLIHEETEAQSSWVTF